ncbi:hypothetical protein DL764_007266 [Monosporascus ibericus]|uniref:Presequence translocated-associated motor subunit PAM17 n=1 Tax=Monosporascus ibericus TaxID=155417 RepID=A0A4Q4T5D5_9PEZI|nr:hypothetical protein DL764_007266 [Monosporascus ibericus]
MLTATTNGARFGALGARGLQLQTTAFTRGAVGICPYSTFASSLAQRQCTVSPQEGASKSISSPLKTRPVSAAARKAPQGQFTTTQRRHASAAASAASPSPKSSANANAKTTPALDWDTFFRLRKTRRRFQLASSVLTTLAGGGAGALLLVNQDLEWLVNNIPMDPFFSLGLLTLAFSGLGWLAGPVLGSAIFHLFRRGVKQPMAAKEAEFFARIKKNRVDPTTSSVQNPVPDFYGEKISSVAGYRQWLKDQRAFNKKRTSFV